MCTGVFSGTPVFCLMSLINVSLLSVSETEALVVVKVKGECVLVRFEEDIRLSVGRCKLHAEGRGSNRS
jgi:hypothetical protein